MDNSKVIFHKISTENEIQEVADLAKIIYHEVYDPYTPVAFVSQFIEENQSFKAISNQINYEGYNYFFIKLNNKTKGYLGFQKLDKNLNLSKLYILKEARGKKIGKKSLAFVNTKAKDLNVNKIELQVSEHNQRAIKIYKADGFRITKINTSFSENGEEVNDYLMVKFI